MGQQERIRSLDGLRCVAIALVIAYHYFTRWTVPLEPRNLYPYGDLFANITRHGDLGVQLFFVISGFVISLTLARCKSGWEFAVRRFARLWPTMAICAIITYTLCHLIPWSPFTPSAADFLPSLTFTVPDAFNFLTHSRRFDWMDGAYWSLFVEVRFYAIAGIVYFAQPSKFARNMLILSGIVVSSYFVAVIAGQPTLARVIEAIGIAHYLPWFLIGLGLYFSRLTPVLCVAFFGLVTQSTESHQALIACLSAAWIVPLAWMACKTQSGARLLAATPLVMVGEASYSLYLLHQNIGVALIHALGIATGLQGYSSGLLAFPVMAFLAGGCILLYRYVEVPLNRVITRAVLRRPLLARPTPLEMSSSNALSAAPSQDGQLISLDTSEPTKITS